MSRGDEALRLEPQSGGSPRPAGEREWSAGDPFDDRLAAAHRGSASGIQSLFEDCRDDLLQIVYRELGQDLPARIAAHELVEHAFNAARPIFDRFDGSSRAELAFWLAQILEIKLNEAARCSGAAGGRDLHDELRDVGPHTSLPGRPFVDVSQRGSTAEEDQGTAPSARADDHETRTYPHPGIGGTVDLSLAILKIRRFEILEEIGRGGHGVVFQANDRVLQRPVALKLPRPEVLLSKEMRRRFVAEAQVAAGLDHPNIIKVFDAGFDATVCYIAQELCTGPSLATWLKSQCEKIRPEVAATVTLALARGLEHAHQQGVLHRDLKPANVLLKPHLGTSAEACLEHAGNAASMAISKLFPFTPKLGDFGICKAFDNDAEQTATRTGAVMGTAGYMAPEQAAGIASEVGPHSDTYGLGALLYEMLTGHPPIQSDSSADVLRRVLSDEPIAVRAARPEVPAELEAICMKCLEKSTVARYPTAAALADDLRRFLSGEPVQAPRKSRLKAFVKRVGQTRRSRRVALALGLCGWIVGIVAIGLRYRTDAGLPEWSTTSRAGDPEAELIADVRGAFNLWHENAERLRDNPNVREEMTTALARHTPKPGEIDRRGFAWHYVWRLCHPADSVGMLTRVASFPAHSTDVYFVTFSRDGTRLATCGRDRTARVWNAQTREPICVCSGHTDDVNWVDFSPDQRWLATASDDHSVRIWDAATGKAMYTLVGHKAPVVAVRFSPIGNTLVSGDHQGELKLWDFSTKRLLKSAAGHRQRIESLAWGMGGHLLASIGNDKAICLWEMPEMVFRSQHQTEENQCASFSPVGDLIACGGGGTIHIDDVHSGGRYASFSEHFDHIESLTFSPDGRQVASCDAHGALRLWDLASRQGWSAAPIRYRKSESGERVAVGLWCVAYSPDGTRLVTSARDGVVDIWDTSITPQWTVLAKSEPGQASMPLAYFPDGKRLLTVRCTPRGTNDRLQLWDISSTHPALVHDARGTSTCPACFCPDGKELVRAFTGMIEISNAKTGETRLRIPLEGNALPTTVAFDGHGSLIVAERREKQSSIAVFDATSGAKIRTISDPFFATRPIHDQGFAISADGKLAAISVLEAPETRVCDLLTGQMLPTRLGQRESTGYVKFAPVGNVVAIGALGGVELWDAHTGKELAFFEGLGRLVGPLGFSADGRLLVVVSQQLRAVQLWDVPSHESLITLPLPTEAAERALYWHLAISPDGQQIACSTADPGGSGGLYLFSAAPSETAARENSSVAADATLSGRD